MSQKMLCPECQSYTSALHAAVWDDRPCPYCGASHEALMAANAERIDEEITETATRLRERPE